MAERVITPQEAGIYRMQAMMEQLLRLHTEMYAHIANKDFNEIYALVWKEVDSATKELITLHSRMEGSSDQPSVN